jgi:hypothetical protein
MKLVDIPSAGESASTIWERFLLIPLPVIILFIIFSIYDYNKSKKQRVKAEQEYRETTTKICPDCLGNIPKLAKIVCIVEPIKQIYRLKNKKQLLNQQTTEFLLMELNLHSLLEFQC